MDIHGAARLQSTGRTCWVRASWGLELSTTRKSQERSAPGTDPCSATDAAAKRETHCRSTAAYDARDLSDRGHVPNSREWSRLPKEEKRAGTPRKATNPKTGGRPARGTAGTNPKTGQAAGYFLTLTVTSSSGNSGPSWCSRSQAEFLRYTLVVSEVRVGPPRE